MNFRRVREVERGNLPSTRSGFVSALVFLSAVFPIRGNASNVPNCRASNLRAVAYVAGAATGTIYFAIAIENAGPRTCRIGSRAAMIGSLSGSPNGRRRTLDAAPTSAVFGTTRTVLESKRRATVTVTTTWGAEAPPNADCPSGKPHPVDRVSAIRLDTGATIALLNPFDLDRCLRRIAAITDDAWLTSCERAPQPVCQPIPVGAHRPRIG